MTDLADRQAFRVNLVVALMAEASPLIRYFHLSPIESRGGFQVFAKETMRLVVSGVGKVASAAAAGYLHGKNSGARDLAWVNVGVAGHRELPVGTVRLAHRVVDEASGKCWYPHRAFPIDCPSAEIRTVDTPERGFSGDALYDMEASGFCAACSRFSSRELVSVVKCVSDNATGNIDSVTRQQVERLIAATIPVLAPLVEHLATMAQTQETRVAPLPELEPLAEGGTPPPPETDS